MFGLGGIILYSNSFWDLNVALEHEIVVFVTIMSVIDNCSSLLPLPVDVYIMSRSIQECLSESCQVVVFVGVNAGHW
jgi:hypothetical protein